MFNMVDKMKAELFFLTGLKWSSSQATGGAPKH